MKTIICVPCLALAVLLSSCSIKLNPDGSKEVLVDSATVNNVAKVIAEK